MRSRLTCRSQWKWPDLPGREAYKVQLLHSAAYDRSASFDGKRVAVIGSGSSSIQIIPAIRPAVRHLTAFLRSNVRPIVDSFESPDVRVDMDHAVGERSYASIS